MHETVSTRKAEKGVDGGGGQLGRRTKVSGFGLDIPVSGLEGAVHATMIPHQPDGGKVALVVSHFHRLCLPPSLLPTVCYSCWYRLAVLHFR